MRLSSRAPLTPAASDRFLLEPSVVSGAAGGTVEDFDRLYVHFKPLVSSVARGVLGESGDVDDVVQDTFYQVYRQAGRYDQTRGSVAAWVSTMAKSRALDRRRARRSRERAMESHARLYLPVAERGLDDIEHRERWSHVSAALAELPDAQRHVLSLSYDGDHSHAQIAERLGIPLGTVKTRIRTALKRLRVALAHSRSPLA